MITEGLLVSRYRWALIVSVLFIISPTLISIHTASAQDEEPPTISDVHFDIIGETWFTIGWTTSEPSHGGVEWGLDDGFGNVAEEEPGFRTYHFLNVTGLSRETDYQVRIYAIDDSNNTGYGDTWTVSTFPSGWENRLMLEYGWLIITVLLAIIIILVVFVFVFRQGRSQ
jgi:hypothetical protein